MLLFYLVIYALVENTCKHMNMVKCLISLFFHHGKSEENCNAHSECLTYGKLLLRMLENA